MTVSRSLVSLVNDDESVRESLPDLAREFVFAATAVECLFKPFSSRPSRVLLALLPSFHLPPTYGTPNERSEPT